MGRDPFDRAWCRQDGADARWWEVDATDTQRAIAAWFCHGCPVAAQCEMTAVELGPHASGTWAGQWRPWTDPDAPNSGDLVAGGGSLEDAGQMTFDEVMS